MNEMKFDNLPLCRERRFLLFQIIYSKNALKFLKIQDRPTQKRLVDAISKLPYEGDIKKLQGTDGYRLFIKAILIFSQTL